MVAPGSTGGAQAPGNVLADVTAAAWKIGVVRGVLAVLFGIVALVWPGITVLALVFVFGVYAIVDGVVAIARSVSARGRSGSGWGWWVALGVVSVIAGVIALVWPGVTAVVLLYIIAIYAMIFGILGAVGAVRLRHVPGSGWGWLLAASVLAVLFGIVLTIAPGAGILGFVVLMGVYAIAFGVLLVVGSLSLRSAARSTAE
ncbi:HdeD family acid-resistance protein [Rhodococcus rhodnii]|uniref:HdeD family acid-resistance protein n=2 Tax=Rhodococcus rhodnii TaxID=38312 RepID=R7WT98_9NOCA|nr:DUF308 domain-containing protein [Rhodococcus rhodnii]EOM77349.1 hypothetical protein Rrhod_1302 [Rhodococcus rhodnii LMG 5362]TXG91723.1 HdeD family acid-resistance protein [Rhodococcus rhodnii]